MTINNFLSKGSEKYVPLYLSLLKKEAKENEEKPEEVMKKIYNELNLCKNENVKPLDMDTIHRYWYSCDEDGNVKGEKCAPLSFVKILMKVTKSSEGEEGISKKEFWNLLSTKLPSLTVLGHTFLFTEDERSNYEEPLSAIYLADEWYGKKHSARKVQFIQRLLEHTISNAQANDVMQEIKKEEQIKDLITSFKIDDCYFIVSCYDLYINISEDTEAFIREYLTLDNKSRKKLKKSFEKKGIKGEYLLDTLADTENMHQISLLIQLRQRVLESKNVLSGEITQKQIVRNANNDVFDEWALAACELYAQIDDDDAYNLWLMYMLLDDSSRKKKDREMNELKKQKG